MNHRDDQNVSCGQLSLRARQIRVFPHSTHRSGVKNPRHNEMLFYIRRCEAEPTRTSDRAFGRSNRLARIDSLVRSRIRGSLRAFEGVERRFGREGIALFSLLRGHLRGRHDVQCMQPFAAFIGASADGAQTHNPRNGAIDVAIGNTLVESVLDRRTRCGDTIEPAK